MGMPNIPAASIHVVYRSTQAFTDKPCTVLLEIAGSVHVNQ